MRFCLVFLALSLVACTADAPEPLVRKLRECGFLSEEGRLPDAFDELDEDARCFYDCLIEGSCSDVGEFLCSGDSAPSFECLRSCFGRHTCVSGEEIIAFQVCDGRLNCEGGDDEADCPTFRCDDGEEILASRRCDLVADCEDVSDEQGCPETEFCADGEPFPTWGRCDGIADCDDGTDEAGCPTFRCDDGTEISAARECDFTPHCPDASDEDGCARLDAMCE